MLIRKKKIAESIEALETETRTKVSQADVAFNAMVERHKNDLFELCENFRIEMMGMIENQSQELMAAKRRLESIPEDMIDALPNIMKNEVQRSRGESLPDEAQDDFRKLFDCVLVEADEKHRVLRSEVRGRIAVLAQYNPEVAELVEKYQLGKTTSLGLRAFCQYLYHRALRVARKDSAAVLYGLDWAEK